MAAEQKVISRAAYEETTTKEAFKYCEAALYNYHLNRAKLSTLRLSILGGRASIFERDEEKGYTVLRDHVSSSGGAGDDVGSRVLQLVSSREIGRLERLTEAVESVYTMLTSEHRNVIHVKYWMGKDINGRDLGYGDLWSTKNGALAEKLLMSLSTFDRRRHEVIATLAYLLDV